MKQVSVRESILMASAAPGVTSGSRSSAISACRRRSPTWISRPQGSEPYVIRKFDASMNSDIGVAQIQVGDAEPQAGQWTLDALLVPVMVEGDK